MLFGLSNKILPRVSLLVFIIIMWILLIEGTVKTKITAVTLFSSSSAHVEKLISKQASSMFSKWSLSVSCLSETLMRQAGTLSWLKSIPIGLRCGAFPRLDLIIRIQHRKQKSEVRRLIKSLHGHAWMTWQMSPGLLHYCPRFSLRLCVDVVLFYYRNKF